MVSLHKSKGGEKYETLPEVTAKGISKIRRYSLIYHHQDNIQNLCTVSHLAHKSTCYVKHCFKLKTSRFNKLSL